MDFFNNITDTTKELIYRILSGLLSSFLFLNVLPIFMFIIYMREKLIFSYDLFTSGLFGINVFFFYGILVVITFAILLTSSIFVLVGFIVKSICINRNERASTFCKYNDSNNVDEKTREKSLKEYGGYLLISLMVNAIFIYEVFDKNPQHSSYIIFMLVICILLTIHFSILIFTRAKSSIISLVILFPISLLFLYANSDKTAGIVSGGLQSFNSSLKEVSISTIDNKHLVSGTLLLLSPENVFILTQENNETNRTRIIKRDNIIIDIKN